MAKKNAREILWPTNAKVLVRVCFLYVGQGSSILILVRDGTDYQALLVDCNLDPSNGGIDIPKLVKDVLDGQTMHAFVNTHPHDDHLRGLKELADAVTIDNVWHSGHSPGKKAGNYYSDLQNLIVDVEKRKGTVLELTGSRSPRTLFDAKVYTLAPAEHVRDDVNDEDSEGRYRRIHENCAVLRFGKGSAWVLVTGDADLVAFRDHITKYHKDRLSAFVLDASHHGSRSFFKEKEEDEPYLDALKAIDPEYVVLSAPTKDESPFEHPHDDAVELYADHVGRRKVLHTGNERETFFFDIYDDGTTSGAQSDCGDLTAAYGLDKDDDGGGGGGSGGRSAGASGPFKRPASPGVQGPSKYA